MDEIEELKSLFLKRQRDKARELQGKARDEYDKALVCAKQYRDELIDKQRELYDRHVAEIRAKRDAS